MRRATIFEVLEKLQEGGGEDEKAIFTLEGHIWRKKWKESRHIDWWYAYRVSICVSSADDPKRFAIDVRILKEMIGVWSKRTPPRSSPDHWRVQVKDVVSGKRGKQRYRGSRLKSLGRLNWSCLVTKKDGVVAKNPVMDESMKYRGSSCTFGLMKEQEMMKASLIL